MNNRTKTIALVFMTALACEPESGGTPAIETVERDGHAFDGPPEICDPVVVFRLTRTADEWSFTANVHDSDCEDWGVGIGSSPIDPGHCEAAADLVAEICGGL